MNEIQVFTNELFGSIRTLEQNDGNILFCGSDVAKALGYAIPSKAVNTHCKGVSKLEVPTNGGIQQMLFITEGDMYRLITHSKMPDAEKFESWVFDEVIPSIRKHGYYLNEKNIENNIIKYINSEIYKLNEKVLNTEKETMFQNNSYIENKNEFDVGSHWLYKVMDLKLKKISDYFNISIDEIYYNVFIKLEKMLNIHIKEVYSSYCFSNKINYNPTYKNFMKAISCDYVLRNATEKIVNDTLVKNGMRKSKKNYSEEIKIVFD